MKRTLWLLVFLLLALAATLGVMRRRMTPVAGPISPGIVSFTATPRVISRGESATLAWTTRGLPSVAMEWGPEHGARGRMERRTGLPPNGAMTVQPGENTVYVLKCETESGQVCIEASATVRVK
jgi:hypothetical protein